MEVIVALFIVISRFFIFIVPIHLFMYGFIMGSGYDQPRKKVSPKFWAVTKVYVGIYNLGTDLGRNSVKLYGDNKND